MKARSSAELLKAHLIELSRNPEYAPYRGALRAAADAIRTQAFGYNRQTTKRKILKLLVEFHRLEIEDLIDETGIAEREIREAINELLAETSIRVGDKFYRIALGKRRRWHEPGKHYNDLFELVEL